MLNSVKKYIDEYINYDRKRGKLYWKKLPKFTRLTIGDECGVITKHGHRILKMNGKVWYVAKIIFLLEHNRLPRGNTMVHLDEDPLNNHISNLDEACALKYSVYTVDNLRLLMDEYIIYDRPRGLLWWKKPPFNDVKMNEPIGYSRDGYLAVTLMRQEFMVHRLIWLIGRGEFPENEINHQDQHRVNNVITNLRDVPYVVNNGVDKCGKVWLSYIVQDNVRNYLGVHNNKEDAIRTRRAFELKYGYTPRHGQPKLIEEY